MSITKATTHAGRKLGVVSSLVLLLLGSSASGQVGLIVNETFESMTLSLFGWEGGVDNVTRQYVAEGVKGSTAAQISANFVESWGYVGTMLYQNPAVTASGRATLKSTTLTFDIKVDRPGLKAVSVALQSWPGFVWGWLVPSPGTSSIGTIPLGDYTPGKFQTISVRVNDPLWEQDATFPEPFDPSGKTYQIWLQVNGGELAELGQYVVTVDNIKVTTSTPMVGWSSAGTGEFDPATAAVTETGIAQHLGAFVLDAVLIAIDPVSTWQVDITAANGDHLYGTMWFISGGLAVAIEGGTGRFEGAAGAYLDQITWIGNTTWNTLALGSISTVGSNKR